MKALILLDLLSALNFYFFMHFLAVTQCLHLSAMATRVSEYAGKTSPVLTMHFSTFQHHKIIWTNGYLSCLRSLNLKCITKMWLLSH